MDSSAIADDVDLGMNATELTNAVGRLEERLGLYAKFFCAFVIAFLGVAGWYGNTLWSMHGAISRLEQGQANGISHAVAALLKRSPATKAEASQNLAAAATLLRTSKVGRIRPSPSALRTVGAELARAQAAHPDLPELWQATAQFINYRSAALLPQTAEQTLTSARGFDCRSGNIRSSGGAVIVEKCSLDLERSIRAATVVFVNCVVRYRGGPIPIEQMEFIGCVFDFEISSAPPRSAAIAMMQLTTATSQDMKVKLS